MIPKILLEFFAKYWTYMAIVAAVGAGVAYVYHKGGDAPRAELKAEQSQHQAEVAKLEAVQEQQEFESQSYINQAEKNYETEKDQIHADWADWMATICPGGVDAHGVCNIGSGSGLSTKPVRIVSDVCNDPARDQRLSDAISRYRDEVQSIIASERAETSRLLESAQRTSAALTEVNKYIDREKAIHEGAILHVQ